MRQGRWPQPDAWRVVAGRCSQRAKGWLRRMSVARCRAPGQPSSGRVSAARQDGLQVPIRFCRELEGSYWLKYIVSLYRRRLVAFRRRSLTGKAADSKSAGFTPLGVRVPPPPLVCNIIASRHGMTENPLAAGFRVSHQETLTLPLPTFRTAWSEHVRAPASGRTRDASCSRPHARRRCPAPGPTGH